MQVPQPLLWYTIQLGNLTRYNPTLSDLIICLKILSKEKSERTPGGRAPSVLWVCGGGGGLRCLMPIYLKYLSDKLPLQPRTSALNRKILLEFFARGILCLWWTLVKYNWCCRGSQAQLWPRKDLSARNVDPPLSLFALFQCSFFGQYSRISLSMVLVCIMFDKFANDVRWQGHLTNECVCYACC